MPPSPHREAALTPFAEDFDLGDCTVPRCSGSPRPPAAQTYLLQEASTPLYASLLASPAGHRGKPSDVIELDAKTARKVPRKMSAAC
jgi:hypothetical protein